MEAVGLDVSLLTTKPQREWQASLSIGARLLLRTIPLLRQRGAVVEGQSAQLHALC